MSKIKKLTGAFPVNPLEVFKQGKYFKQQRDQFISVDIVVDPLADDALIGDTRLLLVAETSHCKVRTHVLAEDQLPPLTKKTTFVVIVLGEELSDPRAAQHKKHIQDLVAHVTAKNKPYVVVTRSSAIAEIAQDLNAMTQDVLYVPTFEDLAARLAQWCAQSLADDRLALAANFEFVRNAVASEFVKITSLQNGVVGGVVFIPGADMPIMTLNQIKMVLQIATAYGEPLDMQRIKEIASVVAGAFISRTIARELVAFVPGIGWAIKAGIGYGATYAMGFSVIEYFSMGGEALTFSQFMKGAKDDIIARAKEIAEQKQQEPAYSAEKAVTFTKDIASETKRLYIESKGHRD